MQPSANRIRIYNRNQHPDLVKLEVNKLGRPYHKLPKIMNDCFDILDAKLSIYFLKKISCKCIFKRNDISNGLHLQKRAVVFNPTWQYRI